MNFTWTDLARYVEVTALVVGASMLLARLLPMPDPRQRLRFLYLTLVLCLVAPLCAIRHERQTLSLDSPPSGRNELLYVVSTPDGTLYIERPLVTLWRSIGPVPRWMLLFAGLRILWLCLGLIRLSLYRRRARMLMPLPDHLREVRARQRVDAQLYLSKEVNGPVTFGFMKPTVLLPEYFNEIDERQQSAAVSHELAHVRRNDAVTVFAEEVLRGLLWFHPCVWWLLDRIQLCREEVVDAETIEITGDRATYLETLLAFAQRTATPDLAPATPFLKRNHLVERMNAIAKEFDLPQRVRSVNAFALYTLMPCALALGIWLLPLKGQPELALDTRGVAVDPAFPLLHRGPIEFPGDVIAKKITGEVVVSITVSDSGEVTEAKVVRGPEELRPAVLRSVFGWHFDTRFAVPPKQFDVTVRFDPKPPAPARVKTESMPADTTLLEVTHIDTTGLPENVRSRVLGAVGIQIGDRISQKEAFEKLKRMHVAEPGVLFAWATPDPGTLDISLFLRGSISNFERSTRKEILITGVDTSHLPEALRQSVLERLNVHAGEYLTIEELYRKQIEIGAIDRHLLMDPITGSPMSYRLVVRIRPDASTGQAHIDFPPDGPRPTSVAAPVYPPLALQARVRGSVRFTMLIASDGSVKKIQLVSGHPLLVPASLEAIKQVRFAPSEAESKTDATVVFTFDQ